MELIIEIMYSYFLLNLQVPVNSCDVVCLCQATPPTTEYIKFRWWLAELTIYTAH